MAIIPRFFFDSTVVLGYKKADGSLEWVASGFFVGRPEESDLCSVYLLTNKHVVERFNAICIQVNTKQNGIKQYDFPIRDEQGKYYSEHPTDDVVAIRVNINPAINEGAEVSFFNLETQALTRQQMKSTGISEGSFVYSLGFPVGIKIGQEFIVDNIYKSPTVRMGCVAKIENTYHSKTVNSYLIDSTVFPGNSGGPVINRPEHVSIQNTPSNSTTNLIGIVSSYLPYNEVLISTQTLRQRTLAEENSGLTVVISVDSIKEVVELERNRTMQKNSGKKT